MTISTTVYSQPACVQCTATCRAMDNAGLDYSVVDITRGTDARDYVLGLGHLRAPVVVVTDGDEVRHWSGYRPDEIKALASATAQKAAA